MTSDSTRLHDRGPTLPFDMLGRLLALAAPSAVSGGRQVFAPEEKLLVRGHDCGAGLTVEAPTTLDEALHWFASTTVRLVWPDSDRGLERSGDSAFTAYAHGLTVFCDRLAQSVPSWANCERQVEAHLGIPNGTCRMKLSLSPPGSGFPMHFDRYDAFQLQLLGDKVWDLADNEHVSFPLHGHIIGGPEAAELERYRVAPMPTGVVTNALRLERGDALLIPRGLWHRTTAVEPSLSIAIRVGAPAWLTLLPEELGRRVAPHVDWRRPIYGVVGTPEQRSACRESLARLLARTPEAAHLEADELLAPLSAPHRCAI